jgi:hypothetical protein
MGILDQKSQIHFPKPDSALCEFASIVMEKLESSTITLIAGSFEISVLEMPMPF